MFETNDLWVLVQCNWQASCRGVFNVRRNVLKFLHKVLDSSPQKNIQYTISNVKISTSFPYHTLNGAAVQIKYCLQFIPCEGETVVNTETQSNSTERNEINPTDCS